MNKAALAAAIEGFNQKNDPFAIGMNFVVAGIGSMQEFIKHVEAGTIDPRKDAALLDQAEQMLSFGAERVQSISKDKALASFLERYRAFAVELRKMVLK